MSDKAPTLMRFIFLACSVAALSLSGCAQTSASPTAIIEAPLAGEKLVVFVKTNQIRQVGMGLHLARAATRKGATVTVIFGADAVIFPQILGDQDVFDATGETPRAMIADILAAGGDVQICKLCAVTLSLLQSDFVDGVEIVDGSQIFETLFAPGAQSLEF